ncbi:hypothetical protein [Occallatibacter savannae]|uniref:hypothetical protein n=1 Tax=Occallatibacter savannae TaxID=1002691 RepID=UPI001EF72512|nr:hypothetical protein [Occallatibacter savannae]
MMMRRLILASAFAAACSAFAADEPTVHVQQPHLQGPRELQDQTAKAVVQDYLDSWKSMSKALDQNRPDLLDRDFVGAAKDKLTATIKQQNAAGVHSTYHDRSHDVQILFYSPEGLSIQLADNVQYDVQLTKDGKSLGTQQVTTRYIVVLTPSEVRWRVRIFQSEAQ